MEDVISNIKIAETDTKMDDVEQSNQPISGGETAEKLQSDKERRRKEKKEKKEKKRKISEVDGDLENVKSKEKKRKKREKALNGSD